MSDHERQVLAAMLTTSAAIDDVAPIVTGRDFYEPRHELIFGAIFAQAAEGHPVDPISIGDRLGADLGRAGGRAYIAEIAASLVTASSAAWHAEKVRDAARVRKVVETGARLMAMKDHGDDPLEVVNAARAELDSLVEVEVHDESNEAAVYAALESLEQPLGVPTPWRSISNIVGGWAPGMLYVVGARPGVGKTVMGVGALLDMARRGKTAMMFSLEMPKTELYLRMLSAVGTVDGDKFTHRSTNAADDAKLAEAAAHIARLPLVVDDRSSATLAQVRAKVRSVQRQSEVGIVVVDYLGIMGKPAGIPAADRRVIVDHLAQGLKNLARDLRVPIVALAQLNREIESRNTKMPTLSDLRESGGIEAAADVVMLMHRAGSIEFGDPTDLNVFIAKNRHGPQSLCHLTFEGEYSRAVDQITSTQWRTA